MTQSARAAGTGPVVILISGRGSNMLALLGTRPALEVAAVISNEPLAAGLDAARARGVPTRSVDHRGYPDRAAFDDALAREIDAFRPRLVVLAGFMRILTDAFVARYAGRLVNIHPALLPAFPGLNTHHRALAAGVRIHGCTVHFVTPELDGGPIIAQTAVPVGPDDTEEMLAARVLEEEHKLYPRVVRWICEGRVELARDGRVTIRQAGVPTGSLACPPPDA